MARLFDNVLASAVGTKRPAAPGTSATEKVSRRDLPGGKDHQWSCGVIYKTASSTTIIERWLEDHSSGAWSVALEDFDENREVKTLRILFTHEADKAAFLSEFTKR
jgi:hypothetical protein